MTKDIIDEKIPYSKELLYIKDIIGDIDINYIPDISVKITELLKVRDIKEENAHRITSIVKNDYLFEKTGINKKYLATYQHDKVLDVACNYFKMCGLDTYKEQFIDKTYKQHKIKGHCDIIISNYNTKILGEVKNYLESTLSNNEVDYFTH